MRTEDYILPPLQDMNTTLYRCSVKPTKVNNCFALTLKNTTGGYRAISITGSNGPHPVDLPVQHDAVGSYVWDFAEGQKLYIQTLQPFIYND